MFRKSLILAVLTTTILFGRFVDTNLVIDNMAKKLTSNTKDLITIKQELKLLQIQFNSFIKSKQDGNKTNKILKINFIPMIKEEKLINAEFVSTARVATATAVIRKEPYVDSPIVKTIVRGDIVILNSNVSKYGLYKTDNDNFVGAYVLKIMGKNK